MSPSHSIPPQLPRKYAEDIEPQGAPVLGQYDDHRPRATRQSRMDSRGGRRGDPDGECAACPLSSVRQVAPRAKVVRDAALLGRGLARRMISD